MCTRTFDSLNLKARRWFAQDNLCFPQTWPLQSIVHEKKFAIFASYIFEVIKLAVYWRLQHLRRFFSLFYGISVAK
jgi:hypothetical protein